MNPKKSMIYVVWMGNKSFCTHVIANSADKAKAIAASMYPGVKVGPIMMRKAIR